MNGARNMPKSREIIPTLNGYYDISGKIIDLAETIKNCRAEESVICPPTSRIEETPKQKKSTDFVADAGTGKIKERYEQEIAEYSGEIDKLDKQRRLIKGALGQLALTEKRIIEIAYLGPRNLQERMSWRREPWKTIGNKLGYSEDYVRKTAKIVLNKIDAYIKQEETKHE